MTNPVRTKNTSAFFAQAALSFAAALFAVIVGILYIAADPWVRAFLARQPLSRDIVVHARQVGARRSGGIGLVSRLDEARVERLLAEHDPFKSVG